MGVAGVVGGALGPLVVSWRLPPMAPAVRTLTPSATPHLFSLGSAGSRGNACHLCARHQRSGGCMGYAGVVQWRLRKGCWVVQGGCRGDTSLAPLKGLSHACHDTAGHEDMRDALCMHLAVC